MEPHRRCSSCKASKPASDFEVRRRQCRTCRSEHNRRYRESHREQIRAADRFRYRNPLQISIPPLAGQP